jgi:hypothetical protein
MPALLFCLTYVPFIESCAYPCDTQAYQAAKGANCNDGALIELLELIEHSLKPVDMYTQIPSTPVMDEIIIKIMAELLSTLALATKELKQGKMSEPILTDVLYRTQFHAAKFVKRHLGEKDIEAVLQRLGRLTQDEARKTAVQILSVVYCLFRNMRVVMDSKQVA